MSKKKWEMKQHSGSSAGVGKALGIGLGAGVVLTVALAAVFAALMDRQLLQESATGILAMAILVISAAIGDWCSAKLAGRKPMIMCLLFGGCYLLILLAVTALIFGGKFQGVLVAAAVVIGVSAATGIVSAGGGQRHKRVPKKYRIG